MLSLTGQRNEHSPPLNSYKNKRVIATPKIIDGIEEVAISFVDIGYGIVTD
ncbi:MAG: hypothetical protein LBG58_15060 [Planctomycetaceae bacterium]|jgi:hypothetical protein|nr:hypothetical protein [Planctomycetaceae bacterium]